LQVIVDKFGMPVDHSKSHPTDDVATELNSTELVLLESVYTRWTKNWTRSFFARMVLMILNV